MKLKFLKKIKTYIRVSGAGPIGRRYFVMNAFDGAMTTLGIVMGASVSEITQASWIISAGLGASLAMGISGFTGVFMTEEAERKKALLVLEKSMFRKLGKSIIGRAERFAIFWTAIIDGISPAMASLISLTPFFLAAYQLFSIGLATYISIGLTFLMLFGLGVFLGKISKRNVILHGMKMLLTGLIMAGIIFLFK